MSALYRLKLSKLMKEKKSRMRTKRLICMLLTICMLLSLMPAAAFAVEVDSEMPFTDVKESDWFYDAVQYVYDNGLMNGTGDDKFSPNLTITRGMIVTILHRLEGTPEAEGKAFADVPKGEYYSAAVAWASFAKIVEGYDTGLFAPNDAITREQMATILYRYVQYKGYSATEAGDLSGFPDGGDVSSFALKAVKWAVGEKLIKGADGGMLMPAGTATRAQAATILMRFCEGVVPKTHTVTFDFNYDGKIAIVSALEGETIEEPAAPERADFTFGGWYTDADGKTAYDFNKAITEDVTLYAKWTANEPAPTPELPKTYTVSFDYNYDEMGVYKEVAVEEGKTVGEPEAPSRSMYIFLGWTADKNGGQSFDFSTPITSDITLYAQWRIYHIPTRPTTKTYTVTFESNGGSEVASQTVEKGGQVEEPTTPTREGFAFIGWYPAPGYSEMYDFSSEIYSDATLYAKWYDTVNTADSDDDGLSDALEIEMGTDPNVSDTDADGLSDYTELNWLNYNPLSDDTDGNGVLDKDEDPDNDGLTNEAEEQLGTNPIFKDSDFDGLSDGDEVNVYHTNPLCADTDGDGVPDGVEVMIDTDPLVAETTFATEEASGTVNELTPVVASAVVNTDAAGAGTLSIQPVSILDNPLLSHSVAGYLGSAYDFSTKGTFESATITFTYDTVLGTIGDKFQPRIYYYNEETQLLEELPNQTVEEGKVSASVEHFSTYILLNKVEFDKVWENEIKPPFYEGDISDAKLDIVFVIDYSYSMESNDPNQLFKTLSKDFVSKLRQDKDQAAVVKFIRVATVVASLTTDKNALNSAIDGISYDNGHNTGYSGTDGSTGIYLALDELKKSDSKYQYIIFITDGEDNQYTYAYDDLIADAVENNVTIYTVGMGSASESVLQKIANGTNGKYYHATTATTETGDILDLSTVFDKIESETIDLTTDSNNDGISDYYTKLLSEGELSYGTSSSYLIGLIDNNSDDWDGDGLKNGEELIITTTADGKVYVKMISDPLLVDTDGDGYSDKLEKDKDLPPMKYTILGDGQLSLLEDDKDYEYAKIANSDGLKEQIYYNFTWQKGEKSKKILIDYFYDYAPEDSIAKNAEQIAKLAERESKWEWLNLFQKAAKIVKNIYSIADDWSELKEGIDTDGRQEKISAVLSKAEKTGDLIEMASSKTVKCINSGDELSAILELINEIQDEADGLKNEIESLGALGFGATVLENATDGCVKLIGVVKTVAEVTKFMTSDFGYTAISDVYNGFLKSKGWTADTWIGIGFDVVDGAVEMKDTAMTYGKMKANVDAYRAYIELLYYINKYGYEDFIRDAAGDIADIVADKAWDLYDKQLYEAQCKTIALTAIKTAYGVAADVNPYVKLVKVATDIIEAAVKWSGKAEEAMLLLSSKTINSISKGCISIIDSKVQHKQGPSEVFFSLDKNDLDYVIKYMTQLAQSRIVGENLVMERRLKHDLASWWSNQGASDKEIKELYSGAIALIYNNANQLKLELSDQLPFYNEYSAKAS